MATTRKLEVFGPYPNPQDPRKPYAVGARRGGMAFQFTTGSPERAEEWAAGLRSGALNPREVLGS